MRKIYTLLFAVVIGSAGLMAQEPGHAYQYLDANRVKARLYNSADHFWDLISSASYEVPKGSGLHSNFAHSLWIGGHDTSATLHTAANTYRQSGYDFFSGAYRPGHVYDTGLGFSVPFEPEFYDVIPVDAGKHMVIHDNGFVVYDPVTNTTITQTMPVTRVRLQGVLLSSGKTMLLGDDTYPNIQDVFLADPANGYSPQVSLQLHYYHRNSAVVTLQNGLTLLAGLAGTELYDPATNTSSTVQAMPIPVNGAGFVLLPDGRAFVAGGSTVFSSYNGPKIETQLFDPATNTWAQGPNMQAGKAFPLTVLQPNGRVLLIGGSINNNDIFEFDPVANTITTAGTLPTQAQYCTGGLLANGDVLFTGAPLLTSPTANLYRFAPSSGQVIEDGFVGLGTHCFTTVSGDGMVEFKDKEFRKYDPVKKVFVDMRYQKVWNVRKVQIQQFLADRANNTVNFANYPDIQTWPAHGNTAMGEDVNLAPFVDVNNDGLYRPLTQGDYPCILGDQTLWWVYHDDGVHSESGGTPIGIQVEAMAYSINCDNNPCPDSAIGYATFYHYEITHKGTADIVDLRTGLWNDVDLGNYADDYIGCDSARELGFVYNGDANDEGATGYGLNPPAFGSLMLGQSEMNIFMTYENDFSGLGNPTAAPEYYNYLSGRFKDGSQLAGNGLNGYDPLWPGPYANYVYPGDGGFCGPASGWSEVSAGNMPFDRRIVQAMGPQVFNVGDGITMDFAMVWARDYNADNLGAVCALKGASDAVATYWATLGGACFNQVVSNERPLPAGFGFALYPNPAGSRAEIAFASPASGANVTLRDVSGKLLYRLPVADGATRMELMLDVVPEGIYLVTLESGGASSTRKLSVQR